MGEYHDLYVQTDTLLLADGFENFRNMCLEMYELDPSYFYSAPGLTWQACLKKNGVKLELLTDIDMLLMLEKGMKGGMCQATYRYAKENNKYMKNYDENKECSFLIYDDANHLYGFPMYEKLPVRGFKWSNKLDKFTDEFKKNYDKNSDKGYILEVDADYPKDLHKLYSDLPFLPQRRKTGKIEKLICCLEDKESYVTHIVALKQALNHGLKLSKVHRVIESTQEDWIKPYIMINTELRMEAENDFKKEFYKLMNNSVFGKTMENLRKHRDIKLVTTKKRRLKLASEPNYHTTTHFSENLIAIEMKKTKVKMNKPISLGQTILDINKTVMYEFWYDFIKSKYEDNVKLCYMDTDSFVMNINTEDFYYRRYC